MLSKRDLDEVMIMTFPKQDRLYIPLCQVLLSFPEISKQIQKEAQARFSQVDTIMIHKYNDSYKHLSTAGESASAPGLAVVNSQRGSTHKSNEKKDILTDSL